MAIGDLPWNREAVARLDPIGAMLTINDGGSERTQFLQPIDLAAGFILYVAHGAIWYSRSRSRDRAARPRSECESWERSRLLGGRPAAIRESRAPAARAVATAAPASGPRSRRESRPKSRRRPTSTAQSEPTPIRMMAAVWPRGVPRRFPVDVQIRVWVDASGRVIRADAGAGDIGELRLHSQRHRGRPALAIRPGGRQRPAGSRRNHTHYQIQAVTVVNREISIF